MNSFGRTVTGLVDANSPRIDTPPSFLLPLRAHQAACVHTMREMETWKQIILPNMTISSRAGVLSNLPGTGKTSTILALLKVNPIPTRGPLYPMAIPLEVQADCISDARKSTPSVRSVIVQEYTKVMRPTIALVGSSVLYQWETEVLKFDPTIRYLLIDDIRSLNRFYRDVLHTSKLNDYDLIIVKNKVITGRWEWIHDEIPGPELDVGSRPIYNMVATMCRNFCFARIVVDDFDIIGIPPVACHFNSLFMWLVSSTRKPITKKLWHNRHASFEDMVHNSCVPFTSIASDDLLFDYFNVRACPEFIKKSSTVGIPNYRIYQFRNNVQKITKLLAFMPDDKVAEIMEALNGDSHEQAARIAGIAMASPAEIFRKLFQDNYDNMIEANRILKLITTIYDRYTLRGGCDKLRPIGENPDIEDTFKHTDLRVGRVPIYRYPTLLSVIRDERVKWSEVSLVTSASLSKFRDSVSSDSCGICSMPLCGNGNCILPCCFEMLHADCAARGCNFALQIVPGSGGKTANIGFCPFNKEHKVHYEQLCYIGTDFDLSSLGALPDSKEEKSSKSLSAPVEAKDRIKCDALMDILLARIAPECTSIDLHIPSLSVGTESLGDAPYKTLWQPAWQAIEKYMSRIAARAILGWFTPDAIPRVLIFSAFDEGLAKVQLHLQEQCIEFTHLGGNSKELNALASNFYTGQSRCLIINSTKSCAGLNLQTATDQVDMHLIIDKSTFIQKAGRIARDGRTCDLTMHLLVYDTERVRVDELYVRR